MPHSMLIYCINVSDKLGSQSHSTGWKKTFLMHSVHSSLPSLSKNLHLEHFHNSEVFRVVEF